MGFSSSLVSNIGDCVAATQRHSHMARHDTLVPVLHAYPGLFQTSRRRLLLELVLSLFDSVDAAQAALLFVVVPSLLGLSCYEKTEENRQRFCVLQQM